MNTCPNCGKVTGLHSSILQGCMCQYAMQAPPQRQWVGLTDEDIHNTVGYNETREMYQFALALIAKLKEKNT
jgi:hypothetical protein